MTRIARLCIAITSVWPCLAWTCTLPAGPTPFAEIAPYAANIFVGKVISLEVAPPTSPSRPWVRGVMKIEANLKGNRGQSILVAYDLSYCGMLLLKVGHSYLVAATTTPKGIDLGDASISLTDIGADFEEPALGNKYVKRAVRAIRGTLPYKDVVRELADSGLSDRPPALLIEVPGLLPNPSLERP
jgi:hypothetical protein